jgi:hypothetical protein
LKFRENQVALLEKHVLPPLKGLSGAGVRLAIRTRNQTWGRIHSANLYVFISLVAPSVRFNSPPARITFLKEAGFTGYKFLAITNLSF